MRIGERGWGWLETDWVLGQFGARRKTAQARYADFVRAGVGLPPIWDGLRHQVLLGSEAFVARVRAMASGDEALSEVPRAQRRIRAIPLEDLPSHYPDRSARDAALHAAYQTGAYSQQALAEHFGLHYSTVSRIIRRQECG